MVVRTHRITRRYLLALGAVVAASVTAACGDEAVATPTTSATNPTPRPPTAPPPTTSAGATTAPVMTMPTTGAPAATGAAMAPPTVTAATRPAMMGTPAMAEGKIASPAEGVPDAYTKPPPVFKSTSTVPSKGGKITTFQFLEGAPPLGRGENVYHQELEKRIGATLEPTWGPDDTYAEKAAALLAGGNLPDITFLTLTPDQARAIQQGAFTDLTPFLTGSELRQYPNLAAFPELTWKNVAVNKKIYGVPRPRVLARDSMMFRQDWANKVGMPAPKNADEFLNLLTAVTKNDPNGNGNPDTWGVGGSGGNLVNLFVNLIHRVPNGWRANPDGTLTNMLERARNTGSASISCGVCGRRACTILTPPPHRRRKTRIFPRRQDRQLHEHGDD